MLLDARGIECSTGSACSAGVPQPSHVLLAMGCDEDQARHSLRFSLGHTSHPGRRRRASSRRSARSSSGPAPRGRDRMKVLAAMSGGVDSAVAAARAAEAGHDVTGVHLALSRNPESYRSGARGCCTIEDANDARRAADVIGIPFYVWDLSDRFHEDVVEDFMDEYAAGRTPNPCLRCNEKIKFAAVLDRALGLGFDAVATGHYAQLRTGADGLVEMHRAVDHGKDQSYVLGVLDQEQLRALAVPARRLDQGRRARGGRRARAAGRRQAGQPRHLLRRRRRQRRLAAREARRPGAQPRRRRSSTRRPARCSAARGHLRLHDRPAQGPAARAPGRRRQAALRARHRAGLRHRHVGPREQLAVRPARGDQAALVRHRPADACLECTVQLRAHGDEHRAVVRVDGGTVEVELLDPAYGIAPGQAAVVYDGTRVVGSATIAATRRAGLMARVTGVGSHPGEDQHDYDEAVRLVLGELPGPAAPARGARAAAPARR